MAEPEEPYMPADGQPDSMSTEAACQILRGAPSHSAGTDEVCTVYTVYLHNHAYFTSSVVWKGPLVVVLPRKNYTQGRTENLGHVLYKKCMLHVIFAAFLNCQLLMISL